jgi:transposase
MVGRGTAADCAGVIESRDDGGSRGTTVRRACQSGLRLAETTPAKEESREAGGFGTGAGDGKCAGDQAGVQLGGHRGAKRTGDIERQHRCSSNRHRVGVSGEMISPAAGARIWIAAGVTDLRRGFTGLSAAVQTVLEQDPYGGHVFVFRGRRGDLIKLLWWDGDGLCLFAKRLERGRFIWPQAESGSVSLTRAQLSMLLEGIDWRQPARTWKPEVAV